jgi:deoxyribodipyrimidine photo-lyase
MNPKRLRKLNTHNIPDKGPIIYWMDRERRAHDNWAMICAQKSAEKHERPMAVVYTLPKTFLDSAWRQHDFMLKGMREIEEELDGLNIPYIVLLGDPLETLQDFVEEHSVASVITDMSPLRVPRQWRDTLAKKLSIPLFEVDARNVVPVWEASPKKEFAAYTIRPKIHKQMDEYLEDFPKLRENPKKWPKKHEKVDWKACAEFLEVDRSVEPVTWIQPGEKAAHEMMRKFLEDRLEGYNQERNDPNKDALSNLSPYLHFGMISAQRVALEAQKFDQHQEDLDSFLEELIVRRELSDNYCFYEPKYDHFDGLHEWARKTLNEHREDARDFVYTHQEFEEAKTHDPLWNACQLQMVKTGKMHGYLRMYWAKKILEWTNTPEYALKVAIELNDKYELDGRDPNGYVGCAWAIGGLHDRAWTEREVYGKVRYMNYNGCKRKFDVQAYIDRYLPSDQQRIPTDA